MKLFNFKTAILVLTISCITSILIAQTSNNESFKLDSTIHLSYDRVLGDWINSSKTVYTYNNVGKYILVKSLSWDNMQKKWIVNNKSDYTYNENGNLTLSISYSWDLSLSKWTAESKREIVYDNLQNIIQNIYFSTWNNTSNNWYNGTKFESIFDVKGNKIKYTSFQWVGSLDYTGWRNSQYFDFVFDEIGNEKQYTSYTWDVGTKTWKPFHNVENSFDESGEKIKAIDSRWDISKWILFTNDEYEYDPNGFLTKQFSYQWNTSTGKWGAPYKVEYIRDSFGNITQQTNSHLVNNKWITNSVYRYIYNEYSKYIQRTINSCNNDCPNGWTSYFKFDYTYDINRNLKQSIDYVQKEGDSQLNPTHKVLYYYSPLFVSILVENDFSYKIYPNPAKSYITFDINTNLNPVLLEIYDLQGRKIRQYKLIEDNKVSVRQLKSGIYFYNIRSVSKMKSGKILIL